MLVLDTPDRGQRGGERGEYFERGREVAGPAEGGAEHKPGLDPARCRSDRPGQGGGTARFAAEHPPGFRQGSAVGIGNGAQV